MAATAEPVRATDAVSPRIVRFGAFELDRQTGELRKGGLEVRLAGQPLQILLLLLERRGEVVSRDELRQKLWSEDTFVDFDVSLSSAVKKLRDALGDSAENPRFIQTLPRRGYRFVAPAEPVREAPTSKPRSRAWPVIAAITLAAMIVLFLLERRGVFERAPQAKRISSIAVLPLENLTGDPSQDYFVDGITDALTTDLAQVEGLRVISRTSAMQYKRARKLLVQIGRELNVDGIVEGSITRSGKELRISIQLIDASTDRHVWARSFQGEQSDAFALQSEIARAIAGALAAPEHRAAPERQATVARKINPEAYDAYLNGVFAFGRQTPESNRAAVTYFEQAIAKDPGFAESYAALAQSQLQFVFGGLPPRQTIPKAEAAARKAIELDDSLAQAHRTLGHILHIYYWRWEEGDRELRRAVQLNPNSADGRRAQALALIRTGHVHEAIAEIERARALDPLSYDMLLSAASAFRAAGQYDRALTETRKALLINPDSGRGFFQMGVTLLYMGRLDDAIVQFENANKTSPNPRFEAYLGYAYARSGRTADARRILSSLESRKARQYVSSFGIALINDALGEPERAMAALEQAYEDHAVELGQPNQFPPFQSLQSDPRYQALMNRIHRKPA